MTYSLTRPQFCLPFVVNGTVTVNFTDLSTTGPITIGSSSTIRYTDRTTDPSTDAWAYLAQEMSSGDAGGSWAATELAGDYQGRVVLTRTPADAKTVDTVVFSSTTFSNLFGFTTASNGATANAVTAQQMGHGLWIAHSGADTFQAIAGEVTTDDAVVITESPDGTATLDDFGGVERVEIEIQQIPASMIWADYAERDSGAWATSWGGVYSDDQQAFDTFRQQWLSLSDGQSCRYSRDSASPSIYMAINPGGEDRWIARLNEALTRETMASLRYTLRLTCNKV